MINPDTDLPNGVELPDVVRITITVNEDAKLSDLYLHACNTPGKLFLP